jgi:hypothetical protein
MEHGDDDRRGKRKMVDQRDKDPPRRGQGMSIAAGSSAAPRGHGDRGRREQYIKNEERLEMTGHTTDAIPDTPLHLTEFDSSYIRHFDGEMLMRAPNDSHQHPIVNYSKTWKLVEEARQINPYAVRKDLGIDYRFWNEFHSNFYATAILGARKTKLRKMQYINWDKIKDKEELEFDKVIKVCDRFELSDIMGF